MICGEQVWRQAFSSSVKLNMWWGDQVLEYVKQLLPSVRSGGYIIVTMKFAGVGRVRDSMVSKAQQKLGITVAVRKCLWLLSNTVTERTLLIEKL